MIALLVTLALAAPRPTGIDIASAQPLQVLRECIAHRAGATEDLETDKGVMLTVGSTTNMLGMHKTGPLTFAITDAGELRHITVLYRHPLSASTAAKNLRIFGRKCFPYELTEAGADRADPAEKATGSAKP